MKAVHDVYELAKTLVKYDESKDDNELNRCIFSICKNFINFPSLEIVEYISATYYEKCPCENKSIAFIVGHANRQHFITDFSALSEIYFNKYKVKLVRKLLQPLEKDSILVFEYSEEKNCYIAAGIAKEKKMSEIAAPSVYYRVNFVKYMQWTIELSCRKKETELALPSKEKTQKAIDQIVVPLLGYKQGKWVSYLEFKSKKDKDIDDVVETLKEKFNITSLSRLKRLKRLLTQIYDCEVGTSCIIFKNPRHAEKEAELFEEKNRAIKLQKPTGFTPMLIKTILDIDGGVIFDSHCKCYAYGCIYDGILTESFKGDISRGARHNSTKMYVNNRHCDNGLGKHEKGNKPCVGIAFSEDGGLVVY